MSELEKSFLKNQIKKFKKKTENQCQNSAYEQKPLARKGNSVQTKNRPRMNHECIGKTI